jgi:hypothetical protein
MCIEIAACLCLVFSHQKFLLCINHLDAIYILPILDLIEFLALGLAIIGVAVFQETYFG